MMNKAKGFTLIETLLVIAILTPLLLLGLNYTTQKAQQFRRDKTALQIQQILNAGLSFYANNSFWPLKNATITANACGTATTTDISALQSGGYLPASLQNNLYQGSYSLNCASSGNGANNSGAFFVITTADTAANAAAIAGELPLAFTTTGADATNNPPTQDASCQNGGLGAGCTTIVASVNVPGQNLNNARSTNFASLYYSGACVPAPNCPPGMKPQIFLTPSSVAGVYDTPSCTGNSCGTATYPITSFTTFARGADATGVPTSPGTAGGATGPLDCEVFNSANPNGVAKGCIDTNGNSLANDGTKYWRVCLAVTTSQGMVVVSGAGSATEQSAQGKMMGAIFAVTRCAPNNGSETPSGSINVWQASVGNAP